MVLPRKGCSECVRFQRCRSILLRADPPGAIAVMAALVDRCTVNGEEVVPLLGGIYGAWITSPITFWS